MIHHKAYQIECPVCRRVAELQAKADLLQACLSRVLSRSLSARASDDDSTSQRSGAVAWSRAIGNCLQREMAVHARCGACSILMGPGHAEIGTTGFCRTHGKSTPLRSASLSLPLEDALSWLAGDHYAD